jgi:hypothetical protein
VRLDDLDAALGHGAEGEDRALALEPVRAPELLAERLEEDIEEVLAEAHREHVERGGRALAQVPLRRHVVVVVVVVELVVIVVLVRLLVAVRADLRLRRVGAVVLVPVRLGAVVAGLDVRLLVGHGRVVLDVRLEPQQVVLAVDHAVEQHRRDAREQRRERVRELRVLREREPELARLERDVLVLVARAVQHVLRDVPHLGQQPVRARGEQEHERLADVPAHARVVVARPREEGRDERVEVREERLRADRHEVREARERVRAHLRGRVRGEREELGDHEVERARAGDLDVERLGEVLARLFERVERGLASMFSGLCTCETATGLPPASRARGRRAGRRGAGAPRASCGARGCRAG